MDLLLFLLYRLVRLKKNIFCNYFLLTASLHKYVDFKVYVKYYYNSIDCGILS